MNKLLQEKMRLTIARDFLFGEENEMWGDLPEKQQWEYLKTADSILHYLHSQGVVIKVGDLWKPPYGIVLEPLWSGYTGPMKYQ